LRCPRPSSSLPPSLGIAVLSLFFALFLLVLFFAGARNSHRNGGGDDPNDRMQRLLLKSTVFGQETQVPNLSGSEHALTNINVSCVSSATTAVCPQLPIQRSGAQPRQRQGRPLHRKFRVRRYVFLCVLPYLAVSHRTLKKPSLP
jgi:hypothetical protein